MPDLKTVLTETLRRHAHARTDEQRNPSRTVDVCTCGWRSTFASRTHAEHVADVLLGLSGVAVTQLPEPMTDRTNVPEKIRDQPMWESDGSWAVIQDGDVEFETDHQNVYGTIPLSAAPGLVAVLLAALGGTR